MSLPRESAITAEGLRFGVGLGLGRNGTGAPLEGGALRAFRLAQQDKERTRNSNIVGDREIQPQLSQTGDVQGKWMFVQPRTDYERNYQYQDMNQSGVIDLKVKSPNFKVSEYNNSVNSLYERQSYLEQMKQVRQRLNVPTY